MDHSNVDVKIAQEDQKGATDYDEYVDENGKKFRVPYKIIKQVTFSNLKKEELIDIPHAARLQYRLMLLDPVIKARVDFTRLKMVVIYNPRTATNIREKMSLDELKEFLSKQGVHVEEKDTQEEDYDYYKNFYSYTYNPATIRERAPYGYTKLEWQQMKPEVEIRMKEAEKLKQEKFKKFQEDYLESNPEMASTIVPGYKPKPKIIKKGLFGKKKEEKEKGFWFHGI
jgi:hypothetical protein